MVVAFWFVGWLSKTVQVQKTCTLHLQCSFVYMVNWSFVQPLTCSPVRCTFSVHCTPEDPINMTPYRQQSLNAGLQCVEQQLILLSTRPSIKE